MQKHWTVAAVVVGVALVWLALTWGPPEEGIEPETVQPTPDPPEGDEAPPTTTSPSPSPPSDRAPHAQAPLAQPAPSAPSALAPAPEPANEEAPGSAALAAPGRSGPVDELKRLFTSEPRASVAVAAESAIAVQFQRPEVPPSVVKSILCRTSVCRIESRWSPQNAEGFMSALMHLVTEPAEKVTFDHELGISPEGEAGTDGIRAIDVYVRRTDVPSLRNGPQPAQP